MTKTNQLTQTALATALIAVLANLSIPLQPVPMTLLTFGVGLIASLLKPKQALAAGCLYLILGACGLPVFANGNGGVHHLLSPTGGFLLGIPLFLVSTALLLPQKPTFSQLLIANLLGDALLFLTGWLGLMVFGKMGASTAMAIGVLPFLPLELIKLIMVSSISRRLNKRGLFKS